ncbi:hypothetical protein PoB_000010900 [Plakobranchus ocellatus]|uniref:Uncharacterized protein n=1 Tax=Plakobranchus ocellatus TaxID=259542 RepID=A0AAV3XPW0_9GAST|nr:hypothetical protein PoB_000010900 [Plakobranchus ocellatus]
MAATVYLEKVKVEFDQDSALPFQSTRTHGTEAGINVDDCQLLNVHQDPQQNQKDDYRDNTDDVNSKPTNTSFQRENSIKIYWLKSGEILDPENACCSILDPEHACHSNVYKNEVSRPEDSGQSQLTDEWSPCCSLILNGARKFALQLPACKFILNYKG